MLLRWPWRRDLETKLIDMLDQRPELAQSVRVLGPSAAPIEVIRGRTRRTIMILSNDIKHCRAVAGALASLTAKPPVDIRVKIDVDPQSTL